MIWQNELTVLNKPFFDACGTNTEVLPIQVVTPSLCRLDLLELRLEAAHAELERDARWREITGCIRRH